MAELQFQDLNRTAQQGLTFGAGLRDAREARADKKEIRELAPAVMAGDEAAYTRTATLDKDAADDYQSEHTKKLRQLRAAALYMKDTLASGDPLRIQAAWTSGVRPFMQSLTPGKEIPEAWDDNMRPAMEEALAKTSAIVSDLNGPAGRVQSRFTNDKGEVMLVMGDNRIVPTGERAAPNIKILEQEGQVPQGYVTSGGQAGAAVPLGGAPAPAESAPPVAVQGANPNEAVVTAAANAMIAAGVPEDQVDAFVQSQLSAPVARQAGPALQTPQIVTGGPARTPTSAEKKAAETVATGTMQTLSPDEVAQQGLPPGTFAQRNVLTGEIKVGPAAAQPGSVKGAMTEKQRADIKLKAGKAKAAMIGTFTDLDRLKAAATKLKARAGIDKITGLQGMLPNIPGGEAANTQADLDALKSQIGFAVLQKMRQNSPTGGALGNVSDKEGARLEANLASLEKSQSPEQMRQRLQDIIDYVDSSKEALSSAFEEQFVDALDDGATTEASGSDDISDLLKKYGQP